MRLVLRPYWSQHVRHRLVAVMEGTAGNGVFQTFSIFVQWFALLLAFIATTETGNLIQTSSANKNGGQRKNEGRRHDARSFNP